MEECKDEPENYVLHVVVVGFHHKKGCQVEYSYPPLISGNSVESHEVPKEWRHLPSLALPDGAHNYLKDTVYFHLPSRDGSKKTVYGVSCYRQMDSRNLKTKDAEVTRSTVQKSVCVLTRLPLYGLIKAKLELITHAYFDECDFSKVELLEQTYNNMKSSLSSNMIEGSQIFLGLSARDIVIQFKHKIVLLFKLILLERRVLFYGSPVECLSGLMLSVLSLFPGMIEYGLDEAVSKSSQKVSSSSVRGSDLDESDTYLEISYTDKASNSSSPNVQLKMFDNSLQHSLDTEPESPTIPRDDVFSDSSPIKNVLEDKTKHNYQDEPASVHSYHRDKKKDISSSVSSDKSLRETSASSDCDKTTYSTQLSTSPTSEMIFAKESSPLQDLHLITQVEAIQEPTDIDQDVEQSIDDLEPSKQQTLNKIDLNLSLSETSPLHKTPSIEDLDSPESISKIDREDCFSWEEDRLFLKLHDDADAKEVKQDTGDKTPNKSSDTEEIDSKSSSRHSSPSVKAAGLKNKLSSAFGSLQSKSKTKTENYSSCEMKPLYDGPELHQDSYGLPLAIFTRGTVCYPYLSLQYHDILQDITVRGFLIGATNILFKQRKNLLDAIVEVNEGKIEIHDKELQKHLHLTTADLRFGEYIVKTVVEDKENVYLDGTEWEGGDEWLRAQFKLYLHSLMATVVQNDVKLQEDFGSVFISAWKTTNNYRYWSSFTHIALEEVQTGHPFHGQMNINDIKMRLAHTMQSTERGKKLNAAVVQTGKYMVETGKAVGGAFSHAKSAVSSWFSSWRSDKSSGTSSKPVTPTDSQDTYTADDDTSNIEKEILNDASNTTTDTSNTIRDTSNKMMIHPI